MTAAVTPRRTTPTRHAARCLGRALLQMAGWFWLIALVAIVLGNVIGWRVAGATDVSIAAYARQGATWFPFSLAIMLVSAYLRVHVASGMTRRSFVRAALLVEVAAGLGYAAVLTATIHLERAVHDALGWGSRITEIQLAEAESSAGVLFLDLAVPFVLGNLAGLLVGIAYQRGGGWWGTLTLPLTVGPLAAALYLGGARLMEVPGFWSTATDDEFVLVLVGAGVALCVVTGAAFSLLARRAPLTARS